jgi:hypothetical protein
MKIISSATIIKCSRSTAGKGLFNLEMYSLNGKNELVNQACEYKLAIGIDGYEEYEDGTIKWCFGNNLYTTEQVERMLKLKVFA